MNLLFFKEWFMASVNTNIGAMVAQITCQSKLEKWNRQWNVCLVV